MTTPEKTTITVEAAINVPVEKVWEYWTSPEHIPGWNFASPDWCCPRAENKLCAGGKFVWRMEAKDGSMGFDFAGVFNEVKTNELIAYTMDDGRKARITFTRSGNETRITETFEAETIHSLDLQRSGWQAILDNFKKYAEKNSGV